MRRFAYPFEVTSLLCCRSCEETIFAVLLVVAAGSLACVSDVCVCAFTVLSSSFLFRVSVVLSLVMFLVGRRILCIFVYNER